MENIELLKPKENQQIKQGVRFTDYQARRIFGFYSDNNPDKPFSLFNGFLTEEEKRFLSDRINSFLNQSLNQEESFFIRRKTEEIPDVIPALVDLLNLPNNLRKKIKSHFQLHVVSKSDINTLDNNIEIENFPLPVFLFLKTLGRSTRKQVIDFLRNGGIITVFSYKKSPNFYLQSIDKLPADISLRGKISLVLSERSNRSVEEASHQFISIDFVLPEETEEKYSANDIHLRKIINRRLDKNIERFYAEIVLMEELLKGHMDEVKISLLAMSGLAGFFYFIDQFAKGNFNSNFYSAFQALVKITTHLSANLIDFYSQYKLLLKGDNFFEQIINLIRKFGWREGFIFANGGFMDLFSEFVGEINNIFGSIVFGVEPVVGTGLTTLSASSKVSGKDFVEKIKKIIENPAILGMNTAAFLTFLTSVGLLGLADQFHNPLVVVLAGGISEPIYAFLLTELFTRLKIKKMKYNLSNN